MDPRWIPDDWLLRPQYRLWPPPRRRAVGWMIATFVTFRMSREGKSPVRDYGEFLRRSLCQCNRARQRLVGNYLSILHIKDTSICTWEDCEAGLWPGAGEHQRNLGENPQSTCKAGCMDLEWWKDEECGDTRFDSGDEGWGTVIIEQRLYLPYVYCD
jgi:hypothetical protein